MTVEAAVIARLRATSAVTDLVGTRIRNLRLRQDETLPAIRVQKIADPQDKHLRGPHKITRAVVQVDVYHQEASGVDAHGIANTIAAAVTNALVFEPFTIDDRKIANVVRTNEFPTYDADERRQPRIFQQYSVWSELVS